MAVITMQDLYVGEKKKKLTAEVGEETKKKLMKLIVECSCNRSKSEEKKRCRRRRMKEKREESGVESSEEEVQCEGDEGFFRRSIQQKIQYRPCTKNQQCSILRINRNRCQYCRLRKCIAVGMSRDAVRFGRVPKREKARILAAMHQSCASRSAERAAVAEQLNNGSSSTNTDTTAPQSIQQQQETNTAKEIQEEIREEVPNADIADEEELEANRLANTVLRAHSDTCHFAHLRPKEGLTPQTKGGPVYSVQGRNGPILACPLNPRRPLVAGLSDPIGRGEETVLQDFSQRFSPAIRGVVEFAKRIPGFALLSQSDQVTLLKAGVFEVLLLRLACLFDAQTNTMTCLNGELLRRESIVSPSCSPSNSPSSSNARFLVDSMFEFAARLNSLQLSDAELALFSALVIIAPDRPGLRHTDLISRIHSRLLSSLSLLLSRNHSLLNTLQSYIPDLRTLNTLHSEKLLAFKMTEQQQNNGQQQSESDAQYARAQGCPAHAMQTQQTPVDWKDDDVQEDEIEIEEEWRSNRINPNPIISAVKSPMGSISSSESVCSGEVASLSEFRTTAPNAPLLTASLQANSSMGAFPKRRRVRNRSGSNSEEDSSTQGAVSAAPSSQTAHRTSYFRKLDSPSDSGIESGTERLEKSSTSTSVCSSPRSSLEDKEDTILHPNKPRRCPHVERPSGVEDMPVLKRVLQAPPLYDTNSLMDEAYKPHKKFRALRKDCAEAEPSPVALQTDKSFGEPSRMETDTPPIVVLSPPAPSPHSIISTLNIHFPQITIHAQPMRNVSPVEQPSNPPLLLQKALLQPPANQRSLQSQQHQALLSALTGDSARPSNSHLLSALSGGESARISNSSSLSTTHSTLARSLMEGPKMTAEQMKRTDIIHSYIMREGAEEACGSGYQKQYKPAEACPYRKELAEASGYRKECPEAAGYRKECPEGSAYRKEIAEGSGYRKDLPEATGYRKDLPEATAYRKDLPEGSAYRKESPGVLVFNGSYVHMGWNKQTPEQPKAEAKQPLNLSKKTPPPSPTPILEA